MAGARLSWQPAYLVERRVETASVATLLLGILGWPGHRPGQHVDVRLTAPDGYSAQRSYSLAQPDHGAAIELTIQAVADGEVSPFLAHDLAVGDPIEVRGPVGGWFVWDPSSSNPVLLLAGGSGVVPLMAMVRARHESGSAASMRLVYSVRTPSDVIYADELERRARMDDGLEVTVIYTRRAPHDGTRPAQRIHRDELDRLAWPVDADSLTYVCGPTAFVDAVAAHLVWVGRDERSIRTERFGGTGD